MCVQYLLAYAFIYAKYDALSVIAVEDNMSQSTSTLEQDHFSASPTTSLVATAMYPIAKVITFRF